MKILSIRGKNLASLEGEFEIDFGVEPLRSAPIFAITGPTGSGKSTLLDAICLALFDDTPRINRAADNASIVDVKDKTIKQKDSRTLLRRGTAEGYAEVDFLSLSGEKHRARWSVRRGRNKADCPLQNVHYEVWNLSTNSLLQGGKTDLLAKVKELIGLTFEQFTRAVLLAQGDFATFLKAGPKEKGDLLEKLTGTNVYSKISITIFERTKEAESELARIEERIKDVVLLSEEQMATLTLEKSSLAKEFSLIDAEIKVLNEKIKWIETNIQLTEDVSKAQLSWEKSNGVIEEAKPRFDHLSRIDSVQPIRDRFKQLEHDRTRICQAERLLKEQQALLQTNNESLIKAKEGLNNYKTTHIQFIAEWEETEPHIKEARKVDIQLEGAAKNLAAMEREVAQAVEQSDRCEKGIKTCEAKIASIHNAQREIAQWFQVNEHYSQIVPRIELIASYISDAQSSHNQVLSNNALLTGTREVMQKEEAQLGAQQAEAKRLNDILPSEIVTLRARLMENEPCPVCGSTHHPIFGDLSPAPEAPSHKEEVGEDTWNLTETNVHTENIGEEKQNLTEASASAYTESLEEKSLDKAKATVAHEIELLTKSLENRKEELIRLHSLISQYEAQRDSTLAKLAEALKPVPDWEVNYTNGSLNNQLKAIAKKWNERTMEQTSLAEQLIAHNQTIIATRERWGEMSTLLKEKRQQQETAFTECTILTNRRKALLNGEKADYVEKLHVERIKNVENLLAKATEQQSGFTAMGEKISGAITQITEEIARLTKSVESLEKSVAVTLLEREDNLTMEGLTILLSKEVSWIAGERESLDKLKKEALSAHSTLIERQRVAQAHQQLPTKPAEEEHRVFLTDTLNQKSALLNQKRERDAEIGILFVNHHQGKERIRQFEAALAQKGAIAENWRKLNDLFGSADGNKFRILAQGYTLDVLLGYANKHLKDISQRYLLERASPGSLSLQVVDLDMLSEVRSVHSLSGGESFLISLALALGLSSLSSNRMRVESLFIDEGFGTLDADTLRVAMDALERLQTQGRKIGVISHVAEMTERISTQIRVIKTVHGKSSVEISGYA